MTWDQVGPQNSEPGQFFPPTALSILKTQVIAVPTDVVQRQQVVSRPRATLIPHPATPSPAPWHVVVITRAHSAYSSRSRKWEIPLARSSIDRSDRETSRGIASGCVNEPRKVAGCLFVCRLCCLFSVGFSHSGRSVPADESLNCNMYTYLPVHLREQKSDTAHRRRRYPNDFQYVLFLHGPPRR